MHRVKLLPALQWPEELDAFLPWLGVAGVKNVLEIGTGPGGMIQRFHETCGGRMVTVDLADSGDATGLKQAAAARRNAFLGTYYPEITVIEGNSHDHRTVRLVENALYGMRVDLLFLDGDDTYGGKWDDYRRYGGFVRGGGYIATHDINAKNTGVPAFWQDVPRGRSVSHVFDAGKHWGGIGVWQC